MPIGLIFKLTSPSYCYSKRYLSRLNALYVQDNLEVLCKYLMDCTLLTVTLSVGIGHPLLHMSRVSHFNTYVTVPLPVQYSIHCTVAQDVSITL